MRYLVFLLGVVLVSCDTDLAHEDNIQTAVTTSNLQSEDNAVIEEPVIVLTGFSRFFFVKDSIGFTLENVKILADTYSSEKINFNQIEKDTAYFMILDFLKEIEIASEDDKALYEYSEIKESEIAKYYKQYGISIEMIEGGYYCFPDYSYLAELFKGDLNPDLDIYKDFLVVTNRHIFDDGGLKISWIDLASQIIKTEDFYTELKQTKYRYDIFDEYTTLCYPLMFGTENSFITESSNDSIPSLLPEVKTAYDMLILDPIHNSGNIFSIHLENLTQVNFQPNDEMMVDLTDDQIENLLNAN
jgi:hypothetical protein